MFWENIISDVSINLVAISTVRILIKFHCSNSNTSLSRMEVGSLYGQSGVWYGISFEKRYNNYLYLITYNNNYKNTINIYTIIITKKNQDDCCWTYQNCVPRPYQDNWRISNINPINTQFFNPIVFLRQVRTTV